MKVNSFKNKHKGERCYILGNGPSLNEVDLESLDGTTFGTNRIYLSGYEPDYYVCVNPLVLEQFGEEIRDKIKVPKFIPKWFDLEDWGDVARIDTSLGFPHFEEDIGNLPVWEGHTVTYVALQLAYYMGFREVILLGVDHDYGEIKQPNLEVVATEPDQHHFSPAYFSAGTRWNYPDLRMSEFAYTLAKAAFERDGRVIYNESGSTKLDVFEIRKHLPPKRRMYPRVSAIVSAYKAEEFIEQCLLDLTRQSIYPNDLEIVVVCQEGSKEHELAETYSKLVTCVTTEDIPTVYHAWNLGIKAASGKYITNANTDDRHHRLAYEVMADILDARQDIDLVYHDSFITWKPNQDFEQFVVENSDKHVQSGRVENEPGVFTWQDYSRRALGHGCFVGPHPMWRARLHQRHGYFRADMKSAGDYEFWLRISRSKNMLHLPVVLGLYHARHDGIELGDPIRNYDEARDAIAIHQEPHVDISLSGDAQVVTMRVGDLWVLGSTEKFLEVSGKIKEQFEK